MTNQEIITHLNSLNEFTKDKIPVKLSYAIAKNIKTMLSEYKIFSEQRNNIMEECKDDPDEQNKKLSELLNIDVNIDIHMVDFSDIEGIELSVKDASTIEFMVND